MAHTRSHACTRACVCICRKRETGRTGELDCGRDKEREEETEGVSGGSQRRGVGEAFGGREARSIGWLWFASGSKKSRRAESGAVGKACIRATSG